MRWLAFIFIPLFLSACKIHVSTSENGIVQSHTGAYVCTSESPCDIDVEETDFQEVFVPIANAGYAFNGWLDRDDAYCGHNFLNCWAAMGEASGTRATYEFDAQFAAHDRQMFAGNWFGELLGSMGRYTTETQVVEISVVDNAISISEERWSEKVSCELHGSFDVVEEEGRAAREKISGAYSCSGAATSFGEFSGYIAAITDFQVLVGIKFQPEGEEMRETVSVLHREGFRVPESVERAAILIGTEFTDADKGIYEANQVLSGERCNAFPAENSFATVEFRDGYEGFEIKTSVHGGGNCLFKDQHLVGQSDQNGYYQCDNGDQGLWSYGGINVHRTPVGEVISTQLIRHGHHCSVVNLAGWRKGSVRQ